MRVFFTLLLGPFVTESAAFQEVFDRHSGQLNYCYETQLESNPSLAGRVEIAVVVSSSYVISSEVVQNTSEDEWLGECALAKVKRWRYPPELYGETVYAFLFEPPAEEAEQPKDVTVGETPSTGRCLFPRLCLRRASRGEGSKESRDVE